MRRRFLGAKSLPLLTLSSGAANVPLEDVLSDTSRTTSYPQTRQGPVDIVYTVPQGAQYLTIGIWDRFGKYVRTLVNQRAPRPGTHTQIWNLADDSGQIVSRGPFIYRITIDDDAESRIIVVNP